MPSTASAARVALPPIRVMVVDDAVIMRSLAARWLAEEPDLELVAALRNGIEAVNEIERANPDVVVLDVDMPELDGIATLQRLLEKRRDLVVIMASTLTRRNAEISLRALALGAADYIPKPEAEGGIMTSASFKRELIEKIRALGGRRLQRILSEQEALKTPQAPLKLLGGVEVSEVARPTMALRPFSPIMPRVVLIGASTGGPQALMEMLPQLQAVLDYAPILITQHMPPTFTIIMAENLQRACGRPVHEAIDGEPVLKGTVYLAPGGRHMTVTRRKGAAVIALDDGPPVNFCKPAIDPLFSSAAEIWGAGCLALVLTGMGSDGARGAADIVAAGGCVIGQDEATSVIWGMPGVVAEAGLCSAVLPLGDIAPTTVRLFKGGNGRDAA
ncbi:MAG TPA: chemotaxis response regulator protein-glutamate methylesterase [Xanthobacteraceae bacterium]|nr:chemotaxis response regulator protein-glutamate methylesterase [Xanthobacteraceae bacterium]